LVALIYLTGNSRECGRDIAGYLEVKAIRMRRISGACSNREEI
jgi:hypothetical protein